MKWNCLALISFGVISMGSLAFTSDAIEVVQSVPLETTLAVPGIRQTQEVWLEMIDGAQKTIDIEQFYISDQAGQSLTPVLQAIQAAAKRGVRIRLVVDSKFYSTYPDSVKMIGHLPRCEARTINFSKYGGVQHAKFFVVDGKQAFVGSQNFDWRALSHIHEVGLRVSDIKVAGDLESLFEKDWSEGSPTVQSATCFSSAALGKGTHDVSVVASPPQANPAGIPDSLSAITGLIVSARKSIRIQVMEYTTKGPSELSWVTLQNAIQKAGASGVHVQFLVDVSDVKKAKNDLVRLAGFKNVEVKSATIPPWSGGAIDFARLIHSKYLIVDGTSAWVGSENWSESYFMNTRDVGLVIRAQAPVDQLNKIFDQVWQSSYASGI